MGAKHSYIGPAWLLAAGGALLTVAVGLQVYQSSDSDFADDGWALLLPWVVVTVTSLVAVRSRVPVAITCLGVAAGVVLRFAGPLAVSGISTPAVLPAVVWGTQGVPREPWVTTLIEGGDRIVQVSLRAQSGACLVLFVAVAWLVPALWRGARGERRWDWVLVVAAVAFAVACAVLAPYALSLSFAPSNLALYVTDNRALLLAGSWVVPVGLWALVQVGRSGRESVAAALGLVVASLLVMPVVDAAARLLGGYTSFFAYPGDFLPDYDAPASAVLDRLGQPWQVAVASVVLLVVAILRNGQLARSSRARSRSEAEALAPEGVED